MSERWCAKGNHFKPIAAFRHTPSGRPHRDCRDCQARVLPGALGVDIDAIHCRLGAVAPHLRKAKRA